MLGRLKHPQTGPSISVLVRWVFILASPPPPLPPSCTLYTPAPLSFFLSLSLSFFLPFFRLRRLILIILQPAVRLRVASRLSDRRHFSWLDEIQKLEQPRGTGESRFPRICRHDYAPVLFTQETRSRSLSTICRRRNLKREKKRKGKTLV